MALHNKLAVITGCSSGIGLATTQLFLRAGATVFGIDISAFPSPSPLPASSAAQFHFHQADLSKPTAAQEAIEACRATAGRPVDVLANVAGIMDNFEGADIVTDELWERVMNVNATAPMRLIRAVLTQGGMKERRSGTIVNVASKAALGGGATGVAYTASKHALVGITKNVAWRFHREGIRCNAVCPGRVATNIRDSMDNSKIDTASFDIIKPFHYLHTLPDEPQIITPEYVANTILFFASDQSNGVNGTILPVDDAWSAL